MYRKNCSLCTFSCVHFHLVKMNTDAAVAHEITEASRLNDEHEVGDDQKKCGATSEPSTVQEGNEGDREVPCDEGEGVEPAKGVVVGTVTETGPDAQEMVESKNEASNELRIESGTERKPESDAVIPVVPVSDLSVNGIEKMAAASKRSDMSDIEAGEEKIPPVPPRSKKRRVTELRCSEVRWFYRKKGADRKWIPLKGLFLN